MRKIQEIYERSNGFKVKYPTSYDETLTNMQVKRRRLNNTAGMSSSSASKSTADSILTSGETQLWFESFDFSNLKWFENLGSLAGLKLACIV